VFGIWNRYGTLGGGGGGGDALGIHRENVIPARVKRINFVLLG
jgi:hypothetical protein